jgi:hypothetical protein
VNKFTLYYIILVALLVGLNPQAPAMAKGSSDPVLQAIQHIDNSTSPLQSDFCRPAQLHLYQVQNGGSQSSYNGGTDAEQLSIAAHFHFVCSQQHALEYMHVQKHLLHNFPSHHFW